jgi:hypothetical protein
LAENYRQSWNSRTDILVDLPRLKDMLELSKIV